MKKSIPIIALTLFLCHVAAAADYPATQPGDCVLRDFKFRSGETLAELRMHYLTLGQPRRDEKGAIRNAVLILHGTTGSGEQFLRPEFAGELFGKGQLLDATRYYIILPDSIGHGKSSKPSDGLRARFPRYGYLDMIEAQRRLLAEGLKVDHLRLVMGTSMGGMHTWLWGQAYPDAMDALLPLASLPEQISGRNRMWRRSIIDAIRADPQWDDGNYPQQPPALRLVGGIMYFMSGNPPQRYREAPTGTQADKVLEQYEDRFVQTHDANDVLYAFDSSRDYDPAPGLDRIKAPLLAINFADDLINPPELGILEKQIQRVKGGRAIVMPVTEKSTGHGTHTTAVVWKQHLEELLKRTEPSQEKAR